MISIGPFSIQTVMVIVAVFLAWAAARLMVWRAPDASHTAGATIIDAMLWGFLAARLVYIAQWWEDYAAAPLSMIAIVDGGFTWWVGVVVAVAFIWWRTRGNRALRRPLLVGVTIGVMAWLGAGSMLDLLRSSAPPLPDVRVATLDERPISLAEEYAGRPVVLNLWASWCPPCRKEMPVFEQAQTEFSEVAFVLVNQGESAREAVDFLEHEGLNLSDVLLDPSSLTMQSVNSRGLPTTLFFDAQGRLVDSHMGEITMPALREKLTRRFALTI